MISLQLGLMKNTNGFISPHQKAFSSISQQVRIISPPPSRVKNGYDFISTFLIPITTKLTMMVSNPRALTISKSTSPVIVVVKVVVVAVYIRHPGCSQNQIYSHLHNPHGVTRHTKTINVVIVVTITKHR